MGRIPEGQLITHEDGKVTREGKSPHVEATWPHHRFMTRLVVEGHRPNEICALTGFSPGHVSRILGSPTFQAELLRLESQADEGAVNVHEEIRMLAARAIEVLDQNLHAVPQSDNDKNLQQRAAFDLLDRAGFGKKEVHINKNLNVSATLKDIKNMTTDQLREDIAGMLEVD